VARAPGEGPGAEDIWVEVEVGYLYVVIANVGVGGVLGGRVIID
jgi:hypothetical protein